MEKGRLRNVIFGVSNLANLNPSLKKRNRKVHFGFIIRSSTLFIIGWTNVYIHGVG